MKKSKIIVYLLFCFWVNFLFIPFAQAAVPVISAKSAVVMDARTGRVLYELNSHQQLPQASTTKVMTAIVALENGNLKDRVKVSSKASSINVGGSSIWLVEGEELSLEDMLYGLMLCSGNDAATAIAEHIGGSVEGFVEMMNAKAREIGANDTHFVTPHGLDAQGHYSSAYDLALIARYGLQIPKFAEIVKTKEKIIPWPGHEYNRHLHNKNKLLYNYEGADGVKTGYTGKAGRCLVSSATRNGWQLIAVVMNDNAMFEDSAALLDYGFNNYKPVKLLESEKAVKSIRVVNGTKDTVDLFLKQDFVIPLQDGEQGKIKIKVIAPMTINAPIEPGQKIGRVVALLDGKEIASADLESREEILIQPFLNRLVARMFKMFTNLIVEFA